jgi:hypothetical protein
MATSPQTKHAFLNLTAPVARHDLVTDTIVEDATLTVVSRPEDRTPTRRSSSMSGGRPLDLVAPVESHSVKRA